MEEDPHLLTYLVLCGLIVLSAFFSAVEVAFVSLSPARVRIIRERKTRAAQLVVRLKSRPQRFLATVLIGNNLVNIFAAGLATVLATRFFGSAGLGVSTGVMTLVILIFGEIIPKAFAQKHAEGFAQFSAYPIYFLGKLLLPVSWTIEKVLHSLGAKHTVRVTEEELMALIDIGTESGEIKKHEQEMMQNILEFTDTRVEEVMIPRVEVEALDKNSSVAEARDFFEKNTHSRLPVYDGTIDNVIGLITLRHVLEHDKDPGMPIENMDLIHPIFTPASRTIRSLFQEFKSRHVHMAVVVDEHGGTEGLVTLEDLLEEIVGEIEDEKDVSEITIQQISPGALLVDGDTQLSEIDDRLNTELAQEEFESKNIAFLLLEKLGRMPKENDKIRVGSVELTVHTMATNRIEKVKVERV